MVAVRKNSQGSAAGYGPDGPWMFTWHDDGQTIDIPEYAAAELAHNPEFRIVPDPVEITEPAPETPIVESPKPAAKRAAKKPTTPTEE